jgi:16S rRNA (guanine966-N2)-methyltransferase
MAVMMVEAHTPAFRQLEQVKQKLDATQVRLQRADALSAAQHLLLGGQRFQLIFLDPPFKQGLLPQLLPICSKLLASNGYLYVEAEQALPTDLDDPQRPAWLMDWEVIRADHAGSVFFHILQHRLAATVHL